MRINLFFLFAVWLGLPAAVAQSRLPAFAMNERLGRGINMGNCFEAPSETAWGNPWKPEYFKIMADLGFRHVRLPVRWEPAARSMADPPYTINPQFLQRIQQVVDTALRYNLHIIVNMHHHEALYDNPAAQKERFLSQWYQIADYFKDYSDYLLFEVLNEPHGNLTPALWNEYFADALAEIRKTNATRVVLLGVAEYGGLGGLVHLQIPEDEYIILSPHYYNPFTFTHQGAEWVGSEADAWLGTEWHDTETERETVESEFEFALQFSEAHHIPVHIGEFGAYNKADLASRVRWTTFLARWFEAHSMSWAYWEFSAGFGIYNPTTQQLNTPLVNALLHNEMPTPKPVVAVPVYTSNFSGGTDGWVLTTQGGANGTLTPSDGKLYVSIANSGTESWHVQLVKGNIPLHIGKMYRLSFAAQAETGRSATFYAGRASSPWNAYSGYYGISIGTSPSTYTFSFTMNHPTDLTARLVLDLGTNTANVAVWEVRVDEISFLVTAVEKRAAETGVTIYPNPTSSFLYSEDFNRYQLAELYDLNGRVWMVVRLSPDQTVIEIEKVPEGLYILRLRASGLDDRFKVVKR
jgi:endoglucanase